jgi:hypothetical protein
MVPKNHLKTGKSYDEKGILLLVKNSALEIHCRTEFH